jgi:hypothetical protein
LNEHTSEIGSKSPHFTRIIDALGLEPYVFWLFSSGKTDLKILEQYQKLQEFHANQ